MQRRNGIQRGVTLIEQIMVIAIIGILVTVAIPPLVRMLHRNELKTAQIDFIAGLRQARSSAVNRGTPTVFCPSRDGEHCDETNIWDAGWLTAEDIDHDNQPDGRPLYTWTAPTGAVRVRSSNGRDHVRFQPDGSSPGSNLTLRFCMPGRPGEPLKVVVANSGRIRAAANVGGPDACPDDDG